MLRWSLPLVVCACQSATPSLYVATAKDGDDDVSIALMTDGQRVAVYACAADVARDPYPGWFSGELASDGSFALSVDGWSLTGAIGNDGARGTIVEPDGTVVSWTAAASRHAAMTGVYTSVSSGDTSCGATVIVDADDPTQSPVVRGAWCDVMQVTPVAPVALVDGKIGVDVMQRTEAPLRLYVAPVRTMPP
jgi:hypothetical protein